MEENENDQNEINKAEDNGQTSGSRGLHSQLHSEVTSHIFESTLDNDGDFFMQEGFTYTGLLLGGLTGHASYDQDTDKVWTQRSATRKTNNETSIDYNVSGNGNTTTRHSNHGNNLGDFTSLLADDNENPWDVDMFNDIQLDQRKEQGQAFTMENLLGTPEVTMPSTMIHLQKST